MKITEKSDVYSYGVVVLEVLTGKQPIDPTIPDGVHIVDWVREKRGRNGGGEGGAMEVLDCRLRAARPESEIEEMMQTLGVAVLCVNPCPDDRPTMKDVAAMLKEIRHERDIDKECTKVAEKLLLKDNNGGQSSGEGMQSLYLQTNNSSGNNSSFSASSLLQSSSSIPKIGFR